MAQIQAGILRDTFIIHLIDGSPPPDESIDTEISLVAVTVTPEGSGSQGHNVSVEFVYVTGDPAATAFDVTWTADRMGTVLPTLWTFNPRKPATGGNPSQARVGTLTAFVPNPSQTTTFTARIISRQE